MENKDVPVMPWEISLKNAGWFITDTPTGKLLKFVPLTLTAQGQMPIGTAVEIHFDHTGWDRFSADVAAGERGVSKVVIPQPGTNGHLN